MKSQCTKSATKKLISTKTKTALQRKKKKGNVVGGRAPYGYRWAGGQLIPNLAEQRIIRRIRELRAGGMSTRTITKVLEEEGVVNRKGNRFYRTQVVRILKS